MSATILTDNAAQGLSRPYTLGTFKKRLQEFEELIRELTLKDIEATSEERRQLITENLRFEQFSESIRALFGAEIKSSYLKIIYRKISANPDAKVDWSELFGYFQTESEEQEVRVGEEVNIITISARRRAGEAAGDRKRRDIVVAISYIPSLDTYLTASQKGTLCVYSSKFRLQACTDLNESAWVTGCDYMPRIKRIIACTERSLCIWDSRAKGKAQSLFFIRPIEHSPQCLTWVPFPTKQHNEDVIIYGDDQGYISLVTLSTKDFTTSQSTNSTQRYATSQSVDPNKLTNPIRRRKLHDNWVLKVKWFPELQCFGSCSCSSTSSFVLEELDRILDDGEVRGVSISKGVNAFDYCAKANIIATGGVDKVIRVWHPHIFTRPTGKLIGHLFTIVDIVCNEKDQHIISLSTARVIRIWDIHTLTSLQVFTDNEERPGEKRVYAMLFSNKHEHLLTGSSVLDVWPLTRAVQDTMQVPHTHDRPISQILFNSELNQLVTICTESVIRLWEVETGRIVYHIAEAHGPNIEITALCVDKSGYRMATGACDGSVKVWDLGSGQQIKHKIGRGTDDDLIINGLFYCTFNGERCLVIQGWNNKLRLYKDNNEGTDLMLLRDFDDLHYMSRETSLSLKSSLQMQNSPLPQIDSARTSARITDIFKKNCVLSTHELSCVTALLPDICATGCNDGSIILWNLNKCCVENVLLLPGQENKPPQPVLRQKSKGQIFPRRNTRTQLLSIDSTNRVNAVMFMIHRVRRLDPKYIKQLTRARAHSVEANDELERTSPDAVSKPPRIIKPPRSNRRLSARPLDGQIHPEREVQNDDTLLSVKELENKDAHGDETELETKETITMETTDLHSTSRTSRTVPEGSEDEEDFDPESRMLVESFDPVLVSCHSDSFIRFWNIEGQFLREISAVTRRQGSPVTAMCTDPDCHILITGDHRGYVTMWDIADFLKTPQSDGMDLIKQVICWRAHLTRIVQLEYIMPQKAVLSGSTDGSVRIWCADRGRYVGFFGQTRPFNFPTKEDDDAVNILPYDITEGPLKPLKTVSAKNNLKTSSQQFEYPLMFDNDKWRPFRRSAYTRQRDSHVLEKPTDKKFFGALIKPKPVKQTLDSSTTGEMRQGAVFRALPVYRIQTPARPKTPQFSRRSDDTIFAAFNMTTQQQKYTKGGKSIFDRKKSRPRRGSVLLTTGNHGNISSQAPSDIIQLTSIASSSPRQ